MWSNCALLFFDLNFSFSSKAIFIYITWKPSSFISYYPFMSSVFIAYSCFFFPTSLLKSLSQRSLMSSFFPNTTYFNLLIFLKFFYCFALEKPFFFLVSSSYKGRIWLDVWYFVNKSQKRHYNDDKVHWTYSLKIILFSK